MADFLLDWEYGSKWVFCASGHDECAQQLSFMYVQVMTTPSDNTDLFRAIPSTFLRFGWDRKLYEEVMRTWCVTAEDFKGGHHHGQQVWCRIKIFLACHWHSLRSILSDCEVCGVQSVGGDNLSMRICNILKWCSKSKWPTLYWCAD